MTHTPLPPPELALDHLAALIARCRADGLSDKATAMRALMAGYQRGTPPSEDTCAETPLGSVGICPECKKRYDGIAEQCPGEIGPYDTDIEHPSHCPVRKAQGQEASPRNLPTVSEITDR